MVTYSDSDRQGSIRTLCLDSFHYPQEFLLAQSTLYVHKGRLKPNSFYFRFLFPIYAVAQPGLQFPAGDRADQQQQTPSQNSFPQAALPAPAGLQNATGRFAANICSDCMVFIRSSLSSTSCDTASIREVLKELTSQSEWIICLCKRAAGHLTANRSVINSCSDYFLD